MSSYYVYEILNNVDNQGLVTLISNTNEQVLIQLTQLIVCQHFSMKHELLLVILKKGISNNLPLYY